MLKLIGTMFGVDLVLQCPNRAVEFGIAGAGFMIGLVFAGVYETHHKEVHSK